MIFQPFIRMAFTRAQVAAAMLCGTLALRGAAQTTPEVAVLEQKAAAAAPAEKSAALVELSRALESVDMTRAVEIARQARQAATRPHDELLADARLATILRRRGDYVEAMAVAHPSLGRSAELHDDAARMELLLVYGQINGSIADYPAEMDAYQQLVVLAEKNGNRYFAARGHLGFSVVFGDTGEPQKARHEEELVIQIAREIGDRGLESDGLNNLGNNFRAAGDYDRARTAQEQSLALRTAAGNRRGVGDSLVNLGEVARARGDFATALDYTQRAFAIYEAMGLKRYQANTHLQLAAIFRQTGRFEEALAHLRTGSALADSLNSHLLFADYQREYSLVFEAMGDVRAALAAQRKFAAENDAALGEKSRQKLAVLHARYEAERAEQELTGLRSQRAAQEFESRILAANMAETRTMRFALIEGILLVLAASGIFVLARRRRSAA